MENQITHIITEGEPEEILETEEIQNLEDGTHLNVIPFQLIKLARNVESEVVEVEQDVSHCLQVASRPGPPVFETAVKGKFSKYYKQTYRPAWEHMPDFKGWLRGVKGQPTRAYCTYCQKTLHAHRLSLLKHTCTIRHQKAAQLHGNPTQHTNHFHVSGMDGSDIQTVIVSEESILTEEDNSNELMQSHIVYATQDGMEDIEQDTENDPDQDDDDSEDADEAMSTKPENSSEKKDTVINAPPISTHVVDTTRGAPVFGLSVSLYKLVEGRWTYINEGVTDNKGRCSSFFKKSNFTSGRYKLHYDVDRYFEARKQESLFPFIEVVFDTAVMTRYHFPLLLSPNSYSTYRSTCSD